jgi:molecular chaperone DnaK (HSP70)
MLSGAILGTGIGISGGIISSVLGGVIGSAMGHLFIHIAQRRISESASDPPTINRNSVNEFQNKSATTTSPIIKNLSKHIGIEVGSKDENTKVNVLFPAGTTLPTSTLFDGFTTAPGADSVIITVLQGESDSSPENIHEWAQLGSVSIDTSTDHHRPEITLEAELSEQGVLHLEILEVETGKNSSIEVELDSDSFVSTQHKEPAGDKTQDPR